MYYTKLLCDLTDGVVITSLSMTSILDGPCQEYYVGCYDDFAAGMYALEYSKSFRSEIELEEWIKNTHGKMLDTLDWDNVDAISNALDEVYEAL